MGIGLEQLEELVKPHDRLLLDTTALIAYLNDVETISPVASHIIDKWVQPGRNPALVSVVTVMEVLVRPLRQKAKGFANAQAFLTRFPHLTIADVDIQVATEAAKLRAFSNLKPPDALISATGIIQQARFLITNDAQWKTKLSSANLATEVVLLSDFTTISG